MRPPFGAEIYFALDIRLAISNPSGRITDAGKLLRMGQGVVNEAEERNLEENDVEAVELSFGWKSIILVFLIKCGKW